MTKTSTKTTSTPNLDRLHAEHRAGKIVGKDHVLAAMAADVLDVWNAERNATRQAEAAAERAAWSGELAEFIADVLAASDSPVFPRGTVFTTKREDVPEGIPGVIVSPASKVEHSGAGLAAGKVSLNFLNLDKPNVHDLTGILDAHSTRKVNGGNYPTHTVSSDAWVLELPYVARPTTAVLAQNIAKAITSTEYRHDLDLAASAGASEVVECDGENIVMLGHVLIVNHFKEGTQYAHGEIVKAAERAVGAVSAAGFVAGVGKIQSAEVVGVESVQRDGKPAVGIGFQVEARGRYDQ
jgi:hypothetical protein